MTIFDRLYSLEGKTAIVTGGATGIGFMIASALVEAGAKTIIASRKEADCIAQANSLNKQFGKDLVVGIGGDVSTQDGIIDLISKIELATDKVDILVNNSGTSWGQPFGDFPHHAWAKVMDVNVTGLFMLSQALMPALIKSASKDDPSRIINIGSIMGSNAYGDGAYSYAASKAAVHQLTRILAKEIAHQHVTINAFAPGPFQSKMTEFATGTDEKAKKVGNSVPLGRIGSPDDIAAATLYLCGKGGSYVTGAILPIDGGMHVSTGPELFRD